MKVHQLSVVIDNKAGCVSEVAELLGAAGVNIRGFSVSDTADFGILRVIVDDTATARQTLVQAGFKVEDSEVLCIRLPDTPGALAEALKVVAQAGVYIEYVYSLVSTFVVLNVADAGLAIELLKGSPIALVSQEEIAEAR